MSDGVKSKLPFFLLGLAVIGLGGFLFFQWQAGNALRNAVEQLIANPPAGMTFKVGGIETPFMGNTIAFSDVAMTCETKEGRIDYAAARVELVEPDIAAFLSDSGVTRLAKEVKVTGETVTAPTVTYRLESYTVQDLRADFPALGRELSNVLLMVSESSALLEPASPQEFRELLTRMDGLMTVYETMSMGKYECAGLVLEQDLQGTKVGFRADLYTMDGFSAQEIGPLALQGLSLRIDDRQVATWAAMGWDKFALPNYRELFAVMGSPEAETHPDKVLADVAEILKRQPFNITNIYLKDLRIHDPDQPGGKMVSLAETGLSYAIGGTWHDLDFRFSGLGVDKKWLANDDVDMAEASFALLPETLVMSGELQGRVDTPKQLILSVDCRNASFAIQDVGAAQVSVGVENMNVAYLMAGLPEESVISRLEFSLTDQTLLDCIFAELAAGEEGATPEALRTLYAATAEQNSQALPEGALRELVGNAALFLKTPGGRLTMSVHPPKPLPSAQLETLLLTDPAAIGLSSSFAPGQK